LTCSIFVCYNRIGGLMRFLIVFFLALLSSGCGANFTTEKAPFIAHNRSDRNVAVVVGTREISIAPYSEFAFMVDIQIATPRDFGGVSPSPADQTTQVTVKWRDLWTKQTSEVATCSAGAKMTTVLVYSVSFGLPQHRCEYLRTY